MEVVQDVLRHDGQALDLSETQLARRLREAGILTRIDPRGERVRHAVRITLGGQQRSVWALAAETLGL